MVEEVLGGPYAVLAAAVVGLVGVVVLGLCFAVGCGWAPSGKQKEDASEDVVMENTSKPQPRNKGSKLKQQSSKSKITLPPHPLIAAEFKGHTGTVHSLDFNTNGKYLASCSDGE